MTSVRLIQLVDANDVNADGSLDYTAPFDRPYDWTASGDPRLLARTFGFQKLAWFDGPTWQRLRQRARDRVKPAPSSPSVFASDRLSAAVAKTRANAALAQLDGHLAIEQADALARPAPAPTGVIVANPPYGIRLEDKARVAAMYPKLGDALKANYAGWRAYLFSGDPELPKKIGLKAERRIPLWNGAIECRLYAYRIVAGRLEDAQPR